ncbi:MAG: ParB/RepB/Spo0J family partition protein [Chloroflexi bacterium]|nr:MAG: ParB/RepB/Spo0J family partition protein [Chloroflexota bacterium]
MMARSGLGRGLDVLLGQAAAVAAPVVDRPSTSEIPLEQVRPNRHQPRSAFDPEGLSELAASISRHGVLQPIVVSQDGAGYELVAGHRRVLAARLAGRTTIPAVIRDEIGDRLELALIENLQRSDLNAIETARAYKLLMETYDLTQEQLAERLGKSRSSVANMLRTLSAPQALQDAVIEGKIAEGHLRALLPLPLSDALQALASVISRGLSVREAEALARKMVHPTRRGRTRPRLRGGDPDLTQVTTELRAALGTKVEILRGRRGGRIAIQFYSDEDFERLYEILVQAGKV